MNPKIFQLFPALKTGVDKSISRSIGTGFDIYDYPAEGGLFNDEATKRIIREGDSIGCFYIESPGMRSLLKKMKSDTFEMLTAISSVIRPGVAESGMSEVSSGMAEFVARHHDPSRRKYLVPELEHILGETYGMMIYQEDVIKVAHYVAGLSLEEADLLRRAMSGKMRSHDAMSRIKDKFFNHCLKKYSEEVTAELWRQIESFAGYAFCKAHSASFALLSFQNAYLKAHYPAEFMSSVLSNQGGYYSAAVYVQESKRLGLKVLLPSINESEIEYTGHDSWIRIGLMAIKNLSTNTAKTIVEERNRNGKYKSLRDFLRRTNPPRRGYAEASILIQCGAMDCFALTRPILMRMLDIELHRRKITNNDVLNLFADSVIDVERKLEKTLPQRHGCASQRTTACRHKDTKEHEANYSIAEICKIEYETFGYMVTRHPLEFFNAYTENQTISPAKELRQSKGRRVRAIGWLMTSKRIRTRKGDIMKFLSLEDLTGTFEAVIFPKEYEKYAPLTISMGPYFVEGFVDKENGDTITVKKLAVLSARKALRTKQFDDAENIFRNTEKTLNEEFQTIESMREEFVHRNVYNF